jgi:hypothetical protein
MAAAHDFEALLAQMGSSLRFVGEDDRLPLRPLATGWSELDAVLPDGGLPRGVIELTAPRGLGGATSVALAAVRAGQQRSQSAWCAWIDPEGTLHAPGVVAAGVELARMLVVRPPRALLGKVGVKVVGAGAFEVVVVDVDAFGGAGVGAAASGAARKGWAPELLVRKLALAAEPSGATVILLTDANRPRAATWPVAMRLELSRPAPEAISVKVAKDRRGRVGLAKTIPFVQMAGVG